MRRIVIGTIVALLMLLVGTSSVFANGVIIPDSPAGYPVVKYHNVTVTIEEQHAETVVDQEFYNPYDKEMVGTATADTPARYLADSRNLKVATGRTVFGAAEANFQYNNALNWDIAQGANIDVAGRKTFVDLDGILVDMFLLENVTAIDLENQTVEKWVSNNVQVVENVRFGSDRYFALVDEDRLGEELAAGMNLVFAHDGRVLHVSGDVSEGSISSSTYPAGEGT